MSYDEVKSIFQKFDPDNNYLQLQTYIANSNFQMSHILIDYFD